LKQRIITALILAPLVILGIFELSLATFILSLFVITLLGYWEWTQFVESKSRYLALVPTVAISVASFALIPFDAFSLNHLSSAHFAVLAIGSVWWVIASGLAVTYPKSTSAWQGSSLLRHCFGILTLLPFFLECRDSKSEWHRPRPIPWC
jgi:phosphatidate cytidylyltransferase